MKSYFIFLGLLFFVFNTAAQDKMAVIYHESHEIKKQSAPFSDVVEVGNLFFLSGQLGMNHTTRTLVEGGIVAETTQSIKNIQAVLEHHKMDLSNVVKCTVILSTMDDFAIFNEVYSQYFTNKPARTTFAASGLARNAKIEIEVIAAKN
tara:strand:- start:21634 stop:22080 length:447 start_codon:yes stop_codon:yes gene_type:complete